MDSNQGDVTKIYRRQSCCYPLRVALCNKHWLERVNQGQVFTYSEVPVHPVPCIDCQNQLSGATQSTQYNHQ